MRVRVSYTIHVSSEDRRGLEAYIREPATRDTIRAIAESLGAMGLEEQIAEGHHILRSTPASAVAPQDTEAES